MSDLVRLGTFAALVYVLHECFDLVRAGIGGSEPWLAIGGIVTYLVGDAIGSVATARERRRQSRPTITEELTV